MESMSFSLSFWEQWDTKKGGHFLLILLSTPSGRLEGGPLMCLWAAPAGLWGCLCLLSPQRVVVIITSDWMMPVVSQVNHLSAVITLYTDASASETPVGPRLSESHSEMLEPKSVMSWVQAKKELPAGMKWSIFIWFQHHTIWANRVPWKEHEIKSQGWVLGPTLQLSEQSQGNYACSL